MLITSFQRRFWFPSANKERKKWKKNKVKPHSAPVIKAFFCWVWVLNWPVGSPNWKHLVQNEKCNSSKETLNWWTAEILSNRNNKKGKRDFTYITTTFLFQLPINKQIKVTKKKKRKRKTSDFLWLLMELYVKCWKSRKQANGEADSSTNATDTDCTRAITSHLCDVN